MKLLRTKEMSALRGALKLVHIPPSVGETEAWGRNMIYLVLKNNLKQLLGFREKRKREGMPQYSVRKFCKS